MNTDEQNRIAEDAVNYAIEIGCPDDIVDALTSLYEKGMIVASINEDDEYVWSLTEYGKKYLAVHNEDDIPMKSFSLH